MTNNEFKALIEAKTVEQLESLITTGEILEPEYRTEQTDERLQMAKDELASRSSRVAAAQGSYIAYLVNHMCVHDNIMGNGDDFFGKARAMWSLSLIRLDQMGVTLPGLGLASKWWAVANEEDSHHAICCTRTFEEHKEYEGL